MTPEAAARFFALLAIVANVGTVSRIGLLAAARARRAAALRLWVSEVVAPLAPPAALIVALTTMIGSLYFSEVAHYTPCRLCWFQRIALYPIAVVLAVGIVRRDRAVRWYAIALACVAMPISAYHYLIEWYPTLEGGTCDPTAPCTAIWFREFGFMTLAYMALSSAAFVIALLTLASPSTPREHQ